MVGEWCFGRHNQENSDSANLLLLQLIYIVGSGGFLRVYNKLDCWRPGQLHLGHNASFASQLD